MNGSSEHSKHDLEKRIAEVGDEMEKLYFNFNSII